MSKKKIIGNVKSNIITDNNNNSQEYSGESLFSVRSTDRIMMSVTNSYPIASDDMLSSWEDSGINWWSAVLSNDTDPDADDIFTIVSVDTSGTAGEVEFDPANQVLRYWGADALPEGAIREDYFTYTIADSNGAQSTATVGMIVTGFNDEPVATGDVLEVVEDTAHDLWSAVLSNDTDPDAGDTKTIVSVNTAMTAGTVEFDPSSQLLIYSGPDRAAEGSTTDDYFEYTMADSQGVQSTALVKVVVQGVNDTPTARDDAFLIDDLDEGVALWSMVLDNDGDPDSGGSKTIVSVDTASTAGKVEFAPGKQILVHRWDALAEGEEGDDSFTYTMADEYGAQSTATVRLHVVGRNDTPVAGNDFIVMEEDPSVNLWDMIIGNDRDPDANDVWTIVSASRTSAGGGRVTFDPANRVLSYEPASSVPDGVTITDSFTYTIADGHGADDAGTVTIKVTAKNAAPDAVGETIFVDEDGSGNLWHTLLSNDSDPDGPQYALSIVSVDTVGTAGAVVLDAASRLLTYKASDALPAGALGTDSFTYTIADSAGAQSTATVNFTVVGKNDAPRAAGDTISVGEGGTTGNLWSALLSNDSDVDLGDSFQLVRVNTVDTLGSVTFSQKTKTLSYTADAVGLEGMGAGETLLDSFTYTIRDKAGVESTATVTVTIHGTGNDDWAYGYDGGMYGGAYMTGGEQIA